MKVLEVGVIGLCVYLWMIISPIVLARRAIRGRDPTVAALALATSGGCVAYLVLNALYDAMSYPQSPYMFCFVAALTTIAAAGPEPETVEETKRRLRPHDRRRDSWSWITLVGDRFRAAGENDESRGGGPADRRRARGGRGRPGSRCRCFRAEAMAVRPSS